MIYRLYQTYSDLAAPVRAMARLTSTLFNLPTAGPFDLPPMRSFAAASELVARAGLSHKRPAFGIAGEEAVLVTPFATLRRFKKQDASEQPRVLLVAPMSGHFATLLRPTIRTMLPDHDVYITDWHNARDVSTADGSFDVDDYVDHVIRFLEAIGPGAHVVAVCQASVPVLAAVAVMAEMQHPAQPRSMTLMAGPIDARANPTKVNELASGRSMSWFEGLTTAVPPGFAGAWRRVYPGFLQLLAFMSMNLERHIKAHQDLYDHVARGDHAKADAIRSFYEEYFAVADLTAEFYLQTVRSIFQDHLLPRGQFEWRGRRVDPRAIKRTALLTVEGERDDVCGLGQTLAAQDLCSSLRPYMKRHHMQAGVGHYGVFSGKRWNAEIYPVVRNVIHASS